MKSLSNERVGYACIIGRISDVHESRPSRVIRNGKVFGFSIWHGNS